MIKFIDRILNYISIIGASMLTVPLSIMLLSSAFPYAVYIMPLLSVLFAFLGYFLQHINAKLQNKRASLDGFSSLSQGIVAEFRPTYAALPIALLILISIPLSLAFDSIMRLMFANGIIQFYDVIYAVFFALIFLIASIIGVVVWFYPVQRLSNVYILLGGAAIFYFETFFTVLNTSYNGFVIAFPLVIFTMCVLLIFNQSNLQKQYRGSVVSVMTPSSRLYNVFLVFLLFLLFIATAYVVYVMISGIWIIIKSIIYVLLYKLLRSSTDGELNEYDYIDTDEASSNFRKSILPDGNANTFAVFIFMIAIGAILYFGIRKGFLIKVFVKIRDWISDVIYVFITGREIFRNSFDPNAEDEIINYKDEVKRIQRASVRDYNEMADATSDYKMFLRELGKLQDYDSQLCYAYSVLLKMYRKMNIMLKKSDTPREVETKVERAMAKANIEKITADFEKIRYAENEVSDVEASAILGNICEEVKRYMY